MSISANDLLSFRIFLTSVISSALVKSAGMARTSSSLVGKGMEFRHSVSTSRTRGSRLPTMHTRAPRSAYCLARLRPMPLVAPRINTRSPTLLLSVIVYTYRVKYDKPLLPEGALEPESTVLTNMFADATW